MSTERQQKRLILLAQQPVLEQRLIALMKIQEKEAENVQHQDLDPVLLYQIMLLLNLKKIANIVERLDIYHQLCLTTKIPKTITIIVNKIVGHQ